MICVEFRLTGMNLHVMLALKIHFWSSLRNNFETLLELWTNVIPIYFLPFLKLFCCKSSGIIGTESVEKTSGNWDLHTHSLISGLPSLSSSVLCIWFTIEVKVHWCWHWYWCHYGVLIHIRVSLGMVLILVSVLIHYCVGVGIDISIWMEQLSIIRCCSFKVWYFMNMYEYKSQSHS